MKTKKHYPNLFIVGTQKAGTTTLHGLLSKQQEIFMSELKEPHYFANNYKKIKQDNVLESVNFPKNIYLIFSFHYGIK